MRSSKSRSRSKQNRPRSIGNIVNRVFDSSGPEGKVRGTPQQIIEKYQALARDAQLSNDRVAAENFLQHAEHYTRMLGEAMRELAAEQEGRRQQSGQGAHGGNAPQSERQPHRREERSEDEQPEIGAVPVFAFEVEDNDSGLVDTPETRQEQGGQPDGRTEPRAEPRAEGRGEFGRAERGDAPRRERMEFRTDREQREPRPEREARADREPRGEAPRGEFRGEASRPERDERRPARGPRPERTERSPRPVLSRAEAPAAAAQPVAAVAEAAPAEPSQPAAPAAAETPKVRRPRAPRKTAAEATSAPTGNEAAE